MAEITDKFNEAFRNFNTESIPSSGVYEPVKSVIRQIGPLIDTKFSEVDEIISAIATGVKRLADVRVATTANGTLASAFENGDTVDGIVLVTGDRILIKNQTVATENGIYAVAASGAPSRATDANENAELPGATVYVREGTENKGETYTCNNASVTLGSTDLVFVLVGQETPPDPEEINELKSADADLMQKQFRPGFSPSLFSGNSGLSEGLALDLPAAGGEVVDHDIFGKVLKITGIQQFCEREIVFLETGKRYEVFSILADTVADTNVVFGIRWLDADLLNNGSDFFFVPPGGTTGANAVVSAFGVVATEEGVPGDIIPPAGTIGFRAKLRTEGAGSDVFIVSLGWREAPSEPMVQIDGALPVSNVITDPRGFAIPGIHVDDDGVEYHHTFDVYPSGADVGGMLVDRRGFEIPQASSGDTSPTTDEDLFTADVYEYAQAIVDAERLRLANISLSPLKRVSAGWRFKPRTGQSFEARDNIARLFLNNLRVGTGEYVYHGAMIGPDVGNVGDGATFETFNGDDRDFWFLREAWTAGTNTDYVYTPAEIVDGNFASNSRAGGPAPLCSWARQWLRRDWLQQAQNAADTAILDVVTSAAKGEGTAQEVYGSPGKDRSIDMIRVFKEAITNNTVSSSDDFDTLVTLPSGGADKGVEIFHNLHGQSPNTDPAQITPPNDSYLEQITAFIADFSAQLADGTNGISQSEPFAFTMMQPGAIGWTNAVNECANQMVDIMDDVTGDGKYIFLIGAMWDLPSKRTLPTKSEFTASATTGTLTVTAFSAGAPLAVGDWVSTSTGIPVGQITALGTGTGGTGTYTVSLTTNFASTAMKGTYDPDAGNGHPLLAGNIYMGCRQGIAEHYICDRQENFWAPKPMDGFYQGNKFLIPIASKFPGLHTSPICIGVEPTILPHLGVSIETPAGSLATITSIRVVPGYDLIEGTVFEESLATYTVGKTGRYDGSTYFGVVCLRDGMTSNLPIKVPFVNDQRRGIGGYNDTPRNNGLGRHAEDIPGVAGEIDWGNPVMIRTFAMSPLNI